ncbi:MAG: hypothetical protein I8H68_00180 [Flavobacteriia bacterium]|nr:hypothetical protein [Flavobacteriia bacterium]MBH2024821.1 hypothetical protein [Flavobacteriales bacterium]
MDRYYNEFLDYSDELGNSGFCDICKGYAFLFFGVICLFAIVAVFFVNRIKKVSIRYTAYLILSLIIVGVLNGTKYPGSDILLSAIILLFVGFFGYIVVGYVLIGFYNIIKEIRKFIEK